MHLRRGDELPQFLIHDISSPDGSPDILSVYQSMPHHCICKVTQNCISIFMDRNLRWKQFEFTSKTLLRFPLVTTRYEPPQDKQTNQNKTPQTSSSKCSTKLINLWHPQLEDSFQVLVMVLPRELQEATVSSVCNPHKEGFSVGAKGYSCDLPEQIDLLSSYVPRLGVKDMHEICRLGHGHKPAIRCEFQGSDRTHSTSQNSKGLGGVPYVPQPAGGVLVSRG